jgi:hypothetical protein
LAEVVERVEGVAIVVTSLDDVASLSSSPASGDGVLFGEMEDAAEVCSLAE